MLHIVASLKSPKEYVARKEMSSWNDNYSSVCDTRDEICFNTKVTNESLPLKTFNNESKYI
jgi:hypothetical protein